MADGMFSVLPEAVLFLIISLLPFRDAVRTSVLSRSWRNIHYSTKNIEFNENFFVRENDDELDEEINRRNFIHFVVQWIQRYNGGSIINKLIFILKNPQNYREEMDFLFAFIYKNKVKHLEYNFSNPNWSGIDLINQLASCGRIRFVHGDDTILENLQLFACRIRYFEFNKFCALKSLCLGWTKATTKIITNLLSKCPVLENLELEKCWSLRYLKIVVPSLKVLVINKCAPLSKGLKVDAPNLKFFKYTGPTVRKLEFNSSLVEAYFDFGIEFEFLERNIDVLVSLLRDHVRNVENLTICSYILQAVPSYDDVKILQHGFESARQLTLRTRLHEQELFGILYFLIVCPNLEILSIDLRCHPYVLYEEAMLPDEESIDDVAESLVKTLTTVKMKWFSAQQNEVIMLQYLLKHGAVLESVSIEVAKRNDPATEQIYRNCAYQLFNSPCASNHVTLFVS